MPHPTKSSPSRALAMRVLFHIHKLLAESDGFVDKPEIERRLLADLEFSEWELAPAGKMGRPRWRNAFWYTSDAVKAGFIQKSRGRWKITEAGRKALELGPEGLLESAQQGYRDWRASKDEGDDDSPGGWLGAAARGQILRDGLKLLERAPGRSLPWEDLLTRLRSLLPEDLLEELEAHDADWTRNYGYRTFYRATRAGWLARNGGQWSLSESGTRALEEWPEPKELWDKAKQVAGSSTEKERIPYLGSTADLASVPQALYRSQSATISQLVSDVQQGTLALPDIQRPFVWKNTKVRDLLDSLFRGYPFGFILTWKNPVDVSTKQIGAEQKGGALPHALVIDGQQRLTSLFAVMTGAPVVDNNFQERRIRIGFHPIQGSFAVADAALQKNPEWLSDVSQVFTDQMGALSVVREYLERLTASREITQDHERAIEVNIQRLVNLRNLPVSVLEIGIEAVEEQVAEIFVRINSKGQNLRQADFILTLLAVFWEEGREALEDFSRACQVPRADGKASPFNYKLRPGPDDLIRVGVAVGHRRARLSAAYQILRGKDPRTGVITDDTRAKNIGVLQEAQERVLSVANWQEYLKILSAAGYRHKKLIQSTVSALYAYSLFLIGREHLGVPLSDLRRVIGRWYTMCVITGRYVGGSSESVMEEDLARLRGVEEGGAFLDALEEAMASELTNDFWEVTLPSRLESSNVRTLSAFFAAQSVLGAKALFSTLSVAELLDPSQASTKEDLEVHHLFPKGWLKRNDFSNPREFNQVANLALLEWSANIDVSDEAPTEYAPRLEDRFSASDLESMYRHHALPAGWWEMGYREFLEHRRKAIAAVIRSAFERIS